MRIGSSAWRRIAALDELGSVAVLVALCVSIIFGMAAFAIDVGALYVERRQAQGAVDLAAMAAAANIDNAETAANATLAANAVLAGNTVVVERGTYVADPHTNYTQRFTAGAQPYNAVRVTLRKPGHLYFGKVFVKDPVEIRVNATASNGTVAAFSVGSRLAALQGGVVNSMLGALVGGNISLSVMDYNALIGGKVQLFPFLDALATNVNLKAGTYNDVLKSSATMGNILSAMATVTGNDQQLAASTALKTLRWNSRSTAQVPLSKMIDLGPLGELNIGHAPKGFGASANVMEMVTAAAVIANGTRQLSFDLGVNVPGLLRVVLDVAIGEPMQHSGWLTVGQSGSLVQTSQMRLRLTAQVAGTGVLAGTAIRLPIYIDAAYAQGRLAGVACSASSGATVTVATTPGIADVWIGDTAADMTNFQHSMDVTPAKIVTTPLVTILGSAHVNIGNLSETNLVFSQSDIDNGNVRTTDTSNFTQSLVTSLLGNLNLSVASGGLQLSIPSGVSSAIAASLNPVTSPLDQILYTALTTLGLHLGQADVVVEGAGCSRGGLLAG